MKRPKHYDRPGKRPGSARVRTNNTGGAITDQRFLTTTQDCRRGEHALVTGKRYCVLCGAEL